MNKAIILGLAIATAMTLSLDFAPAQGRRSDSVVKAKARLEKSPAGKAVVVVTLDVNPGWHLYANPVGNEDLDGSQVIVKIADAKADIAYPAGKEITDKTLGKYKIYEDKVEIRATLDKAPSASGPIDVSIRVQACDDKNCLPPATMKLQAQ
jgi:DsbC/DsbD-like thiol-disulfide interchange protein